MSKRSRTILRVLGAVAVVVVVAVALIDILGNYRIEKQAGQIFSKGSSLVAPAPIANPGPSANSIAPGSASSVVVVQIDGLNFRAMADPTSRPLRGLKRGEQLVLLGKSNGWYNVVDSGGDVGWVTADPQFVQVRPAGN